MLDSKSLKENLEKNLHNTGILMIFSVTLFPQEIRLITSKQDLVKVKCLCTAGKQWPECRGSVETGKIFVIYTFNRGSRK